jgi:hypothetical protein
VVKIDDKRRIELFESLVNNIDKVVINSSNNIPTFGEWPIQDNIILDGRKFSFKKHEYLIEPYNDDHPFQVEIKATQLGLTSKAILRVFYNARYGSDKYRGIGYYFPSRTDVTDLSKTRLTPLIEDNPETIGLWMRDIDAANVKMIWKSPLYLRGMKSRIGMKSSPMDFVVFDELDEAPQNSVDMILERMAHSDVGELLFLSNPTLPDYGIDKLFQTTDQQFFLLKCTHCNAYTDMVETFPDCLQIVRGVTIRACCKCGKELDPAHGEWVAKRPAIKERRGRQYSQLYAQTKMTSPELILNKFRTTDNLTDFYNLKIGIAYVDAQNRLSVEEVLNCCGNSGMHSSSDDGCFMGVDQGNHLHVVIGKRHPQKRGELIFMDVLKGNNNNDKSDESGWKQLDELMNRFKVMRCVVDALPNTKSARNFAERFPGRVFLSYYSEFQKGSYRWNERDMSVHSNRTESLDASHKEIIEQNIVLPRRSDTVDEFAKQMHNIAKRLETDEETGSQRYIYLRLGADHFRHAYNYECMARRDAPELLFPELI